MWHMAGWGWIGMLLFWALIVAGIVFLVRALVLAPRDRGDVVRNGDRALEILRERYARGEIDEAAFERSKRELS